MNNHLIQQNKFNYISSVSKGATTAKALIASAQLEAEKIIIAARKEADELLANALAEISLKQERLKTSQRVLALHTWRKAIAVAKEDLLLLAETLSKSVLQKELFSSPESILNRIELAHEMVENLTSVTLELSEKDFSLIKEKLGTSNKDFKFKVNSTLKEGEFILDTKRSKIKSSPNFHLENLLKAIKLLAPTFKQISKVISDETI